MSTDSNISQPATRLPTSTWVFAHIVVLTIGAVISSPLWGEHWMALPRRRW